MKSSPGVRPAAVTARGWGWRHAGRTRPAVSGLDLDIRPGERVLLLGPSGAGKSTLLHALAGVLGDGAAGASGPAGDIGDAEDADETGSLLIDGAAPRAQRGRAGLVQQDPETQVVLSRLGDDVAFGAENLAVPAAEIWPRVREALDDVGLGRLPLDHPTSALSGGQKQRLALAGILAMRPGLLLLDEPTANLDPAGVLEVRDAVGRCLDKTGATLVVVEHRVGVWKDLVDRIVVLQPGSATDSAVLIDGPPDRVLAEARDMLIGAGVWVPGHVPATRMRLPARGAGHVLLAAEGLAVSRERPRRAGLRDGFRTIAPRPVQSGVSVQVRAGEALTITGANGTGKSTLALTLAGLLRPVAGTVGAAAELSSPAAGHSSGHSADRLSRGAGPDPYRWKAQQLIARIGTVFQEPEHQFVTGKVLDELMFGPRHLGYGEDRVDELLERLRLTELVDANPYTLSGGEKRRLSVATVLAAHPQVLVLDEPTFGQDANTWAELASFLSELLDAGTAVVSVTHDAEFSAVLGGTELRLRPRETAAADAPGPDLQLPEGASP
ncbi:ABC transporter ATP-binding protein [Arthrobacter sp. MW3 TE3886]|uniref:ABC transporter ATP-binding protein n=1 Tax=Arthrobacter sp. MW3 TE3886 TaxID=3156254 RepID=UPI003517F98E